MNDLKILRDIIRLKSEKNNKKLKIIIIILALIAVSLFILDAALALIPIITALTLALIGASNPDRWLTRDEYYSLTGATHPDGSHRCYYCGGRESTKKGNIRPPGSTPIAQNAREDCLFRVGNSL